MTAPRSKFRRTLLLVTVVGAGLAVDALPASAGWRSDTSWITPGGTLSSSKLLALVDEIDGRLGRVEVRVNGSNRISGTGVYCGATAPTVGDLSDLSGFKGYAGGKAACEAVPECKSSKTAHVCSGEEIVRSAQISMTMPAGWFATGFGGRAVASSGTTDRTVESTDCQGFKSGVCGTGTVTWTGSAWDPTGPAPKTGYCGEKRPVLCCD